MPHQSMVRQTRSGVGTCVEWSGEEGRGGGRFHFTVMVMTGMRKDALIVAAGRAGETVIAVGGGRGGGGGGAVAEPRLGGGPGVTSASVEDAPRRVKVVPRCRGGCGGGGSAGGGGWHLESCIRSRIRRVWRVEHAA